MDAIRLPSRRAPFEFERDPSFKECHMDAFTDDQKVNYEELWRTWVHNGKHDGCRIRPRLGRNWTLPLHWRC